MKVKHTEELTLALQVVPWYPYHVGSVHCLSIKRTYIIIYLIIHVRLQYVRCNISIYIYGLRTKLLVWGICHHQSRVLYVPDINIKAEACNLHCGVI